MAPSIFKDKGLQDLFDKRGFVVVKFLDQEEVDFLNQKFDELHPSVDSQRGFVSGSYSSDFEYKKKASDTVISVFGKHFERLFTNYQTFGAAFLYKPASLGSELGVHQDWTIVDEEKYVAINCWVPLTDINEINGALQMMPGSQYDKYKTVRSPTIPFFFHGSESEVIPKTIPFFIKAGEAILLNQSVIHYSPPNKSGKIRKAITAGVKTKNAPMVFNYKNADDKIEKYEMPEDFLISFDDFAKNIFEQPKSGKLIDTIQYKNPILEKEVLIPLLTKLKNDGGYKKSSAFWGANFFRKWKKKEVTVK